jgi:calcineurin-like phosphoesterase family protein
VASGATVLAAVALLAALVGFGTVRGREPQSDGIVDPDPSRARSPQTPPVRASIKRRALVWAVGDGNAGAAAREIVRRIVASRPNLFLYLGDVYPRGTPGDFSRNYAPTYGRLARLTAPTPGNHDWPEVSQGYEPYWLRARGRRPASFYSLRIAGWQLLSLNSEAPHAPASAQLRWLRRRVRGGGTCRLAFWHRPRYSAGTVHGDQRDVAPLWNAVRGRTALVLNGHEHDMQHLRSRSGTTELIAGAGGHSRYPLERADRRVVWADASHDGALRLRLRPGRASFSFVAAGGRVLHRGSARCHASESQLARQTLGARAAPW